MISTAPCALCGWQWAVWPLNGKRLCSECLINVRIFYHLTRVVFS